MDKKKQTQARNDDRGAEPECQKCGTVVPPWHDGAVLHGTGRAPLLPFAGPRTFLFKAPSGVLFGGSLGVLPGDLRLVLV